MAQFDSEVTVRRQRFSNLETGWAVVEAILPDGSPVVLVGALAHLEERERASVVGSWEDSRYGPQVKVTQALALPPTEEAAVLAYLRRVPGVGERRARRLVEAHGAEGVIAAIDLDPRSALARRRDGRDGGHAGAAAAGSVCA